MLAIVAATSNACAPNRPAAPVYPRDLAGCYALYDSTGTFASKHLYFVPPFVEIESVAREAERDPDRPALNLFRLDSAHRPILPHYLDEGLRTQWRLSAGSDTAVWIFSNGFSGTSITFALRDVQRGTLRGFAHEFFDVGPQETGPFAVTAMRVECRRGSPNAVYQWKGAPVDHVILAIDNLERGMEIFRQATTIKPVYGGVHPGRGTRNALVSLGNGAYLEIIAPNPLDTSAAAKETRKYFARFRRLTAYGWAAHTSNMDSTVAQLEKNGFRGLQVSSGSRARPDGKRLKWRTMSPWGVESSVLPFFIEWSKDSPHPSSDAPGGCAMRGLNIRAPNSDAIGTMLIRAGLDVSLGPSREEALYITIRCGGQDLSLY